MASRKIGYLKMLIMGPPGSGKGTISTRIVKDFNLKHLSSGDLLRNQIQKQTVVGIEAKKYMDQGKMVPSHLLVKLVADEIACIKNMGCLLDGVTYRTESTTTSVYVMKQNNQPSIGFPRKLKQAKYLDSVHEMDLVLNLDVPFNVIIDRIKGRWLHPGSGRIYHTEFNPPKVPGKDDETGEDLIQRDDDKPETVMARLDQYQELTKPVIEHYRVRDKIVEISGEYSNEIWPKVHEHLSKIIKPKQYTNYS